MVDDRNAEARLDEDLLLIQTGAGIRSAAPESDPRPRRPPAAPLVSSSRIANSSPPEAGRSVADANARRQSLGNLKQHTVAGDVAEAVVDRLEVIEVQEEHGQLEMLAPGPGQSVANALVE